MRKHIYGFLDFIREQGVIGLAIGIIIGGSVKQVVAALVTDIVTPLLGLVLGSASNLKEAYLQIGSAKLLYGDFLSTLIDFTIIAAIIYFGTKAIDIKKLDKEKLKK